MPLSQVDNELRPREWTRLLNDIETEQCILFLGSSLATASYNGQTLPLNAIFALHLAKELEEDGISYEKTQSQNLPYIAQKFLSTLNATRTDLEFEISEIYKKYASNIPSIYQELAKFPFHFIINTNVDNFMLQALHHQGKVRSLNLDYNFKKDKEPKIETISKNAPLIYNLFGSINDSDSMVLTTIDQVTFIRNIVKDEPPLPRKIRNQFDKRKTYIFVDFDVNHWQFRLLFDGLNLQKENKTLLPKHSTTECTPLTKDFFENRFNFRFLNKDFTTFLNHLTEKYKTPSYQPKTPNIVSEKHIFIAFVREDEEFCKQLVKAMANKKTWKISHQDTIVSGNKNDQITTEMNNADVIIPILTSNFFADEDFIERAEIEKLIRNSNKKIIPILAKSCDWKSTIYKDLFILPNPTTPIDMSDNIAKAYQQIIEDITKSIS